MFPWERSIHSFFECPLVLVSRVGTKRLRSSNILNMYMRSPLSRLVLWSVMPKHLLRSSGVMTLPWRSRRVKRFWTFSIKLLSPEYTGFHTWTQYSRWGLTCILYMLLRNVGFLDLKDLLMMLISLLAFFSRYRYLFMKF